MDQLNKPAKSEIPWSITLDGRDDVVPVADSGGRGSGGAEIRLRSGAGRAVIAAAVLGSALAYMSDDMLNVALVSVSRDLSVGVSEMQWVVNGYFLTMLSLMLTAGSFGDVRGHRRTFLAGLAIFSSGALVSATAPVVAALVLGRAIQGVGAALVLAAALALVNGSFAEDERSRAVGVYMGITAVATVAGPVLGGLLIDLVSWRAIFVAPLVFPLAAAVIGTVWVPEPRLHADRSVDTVGALLALVTISAFSFALDTWAGFLDRNWGDCRVRDGDRRCARFPSPRTQRRRADAATDPVPQPGVLRRERGHASVLHGFGRNVPVRGGATADHPGLPTSNCRPSSRPHLLHHVARLPSRRQLGRQDRTEDSCRCRKPCRRSRCLVAELRRLRLAVHIGRVPGSSWRSRSVWQRWVRR